MSETKKDKVEKEKKPQFVCPQWLAFETEDGAHNVLASAFVSGISVIEEPSNVVSDEAPQYLIHIQSAGGLAITIGGLTLKQANGVSWRIRHCLSQTRNGQGLMLSINSEVQKAKERLTEDLVRLVDSN